jgi:streptogramin lyase
VDVDVKGNLVWFSEVFSDRIGRFDPKANTFVEYPHPDADSDVRRIQVDRANPNRVWWSSPRHDKIGYLQTIN